MRFRICIAIAVAMLLGACGPSEPTTGPVEPVAIAELDTAVRDSAQILLDRGSIPIAVIYFGFTNRDDVIRYEWIDYRPDGDVLAVAKDLGGGGATGLARSAGEWRVAVESSEGSVEWRSEPALAANPDVVPIVSQLEAMATQVTPASPPLEATRQEASDGSALWTLRSPDEEAPVGTHEWIINPDGVLQFYRLFFNEPVLGEDIGTVVVEYGVADEEIEPVIIPELGTPLQLDGLGIPEPLRELEG